MKNFKRVLSVLLVCTMIVPMCMFTTGAKDVASYLWSTTACKYSSRTNSTLTVKENGVVVPKTDGFTFQENEKGGISVHTPTYEEFAGAYGVSAVTSTSTTKLDNLTLVINPDEFDFSRDAKANASNHISILWSEEQPKDIMEMNNAEGPSSNGLRNLIPTNADNVRGVPASAVDPSKHNGKSLFIDIHNAYDEYSGTKIASSIYIIYYDGYYINHNDGAAGYRWAFSARNTSQTPLGDSTGIKSYFEKIDMTYGLVVSIKPDDTYGYVVNVNGKDYCDPEKIGWFPDANIDGTSHGMFSDKDITERTEAWKQTMTYNRTPIDLSGLKGLEGYLTIGAASNDDQAFPEHRCDYTISYINTYPAATWEGQEMPPHEHEYSLIDTIDATCTEVGKEVYQCSCGASYSDDLDALGHDLKKIEATSYDATCTTEGLLANRCKRCGYSEEIVLPALGHNLDDWYVSTVATPDANGVKTRECLRCDYSTTKEYKYTEKDEYIEDWEISSENLALNNLITNGYITTYGADDEIVDASINEDGELFVKDIAAMTGNNWVYKTVTKAANKNKVSLHNFSIDVTPVANETYGTYADTISFSFSNLYNKYNFAGEHSMGSKLNSSSFHGVPAEEYYRAGTYYGSPDSVKEGAAEDEFTVILTLLEYASVNGQPWDGSVDGDGYYDSYQWSIISGGNYWDGKVVKLYEPIKQGDLISLSSMYYAWEDTQIVFFYLNDNEITLDTCSNSQLQGQDYYFTVSTYSPQVDVDRTAEGQKYPDSESSTSFVINSINYDSVANFEGWTFEHNCADIFDDFSDIYAGYDLAGAKWITVKAPTCVDEGLKAVDCPYCDGYAAEEVIPALGGDHVFENYVSDGNATCTEDGTKTAKCENCDVTDTVADEGSALGHTLGEWEVTKQPTIAEEGEQVVKCTVCGEVIETQAIDKLPPFEDVKESDWFYDAVMYCAGKGYVTGTSATTFNPTGKLTRAAFVVILARVAGADLSKYDESPFTDVAVGDWYGPAIIWAYETGYVNGLGNGTTFGPKNNMPRQQLATMFFRYAEKAGLDVEGRADLSVYTDGDKIASWAADACAWAVDAGLMKSTSTTSLVFAPLTTVTRAQAAQVFMNYDENLAGK